ncbi:MAG: FAD:protein FMN transferase [Oscillospiraceae bacterium]|jgi:thiamine biosynthesis lipoprotein|nr:FAD:protein FMN transferase [Oscillospiraceae bacterium]
MKQGQKRLRLWAAIAGVLVIAAVLLYSLAPRQVTQTDFDMGSVRRLTVWRSGNLRLAPLPSYEAQAAAQPPPPPVEALIAATGGAFDPYIGALVALWNIDSKDGSPPRVPAQAEIDAALQERALDPGAYGKGLACDFVLQALGGDRRIRGGVLDLGGNILTFGSKPFGAPFKVALRDPLGGANDTLGVFTLEGTHFLSTSGSYEKYFTQGGVRYHHIFDPKTGYPAARDPGLCSVTVLSDSGALGDALSTACFVLGYAQAGGLPWNDRGALFLYEDGSIKALGDIEQMFTITNEKYHWVSE